MEVNHGLVQKSNLSSRHAVEDLASDTLIEEDLGHKALLPDNHLLHDRLLIFDQKAVAGVGILDRRGGQQIILLNALGSFVRTVPLLQLRDGLRADVDLGSVEEVLLTRPLKAARGEVVVVASVLETKAFTAWKGKTLKHLRVEE